MKKRRRRRKKRVTKVGTYKGKPFRGLWELSYYKHLEGLGVDLEEVGYEAVAIPYECGGKKRRYFPDFLVRSLGLLVEVKSSYALRKRRGHRVIEAKRRAAEAWCEGEGLSYRIVTEDDFPVASYRAAYADPDVEWTRR